MACLSSFFRFLIRMGMVSANPCDKLERPRTEQSPPRGLGPEEMRRLLAVIPDTPVGIRNRAIILTLVLIGRRREEVFRLRAGDIVLDSGVPFYLYRGKGGKTGRRELPRPAYQALRAAQRAFGRELEDIFVPEIPCGLLRPVAPCVPPPSTLPCSRTSRRPGSTRSVFTSSGTQPPSCGVTVVSRSDRCRASWTTPRFR